MLSHEENELMCRVGPGTGMGEVMRRAWMPALLSSELPERGGDPVHVELRGENFAAFRDGDGNVGLLDEHCCHRGASLTIGRVEQCGIRCIYHGWLFAADGTVLETPNVADPRFKERVKAKSYPVREAGGIIWTFLGDAQFMPPFPDYKFIDAPDSHRLPTVTIVGCNYVQVLEGILDSSHLSVLHSSALQGAADRDLSFAKQTSHMQFDPTPRIEAEETELGLHYAAIRTNGTHEEIRVTQFIAPCFQLNPNGDIWSALVPMADDKTAFYQVWWSDEQRYGEEPLRSQQAEIVGLDEATQAAFGMTRATFDSPQRMSRANGWRQDRKRMREGHFTGMPSFTQEDAVCCVTSGGIRDRSRERLSTADAAIGMTYRVLLRSVRNVMSGGQPVGAGLSVAHVRGDHATREPGTNWRTLVQQPQATVRAASA
jgi:phenylpropionate dioxygenase-like ring-hydroxylating dioxygenase large terminal subunit